jgi:hypothetical protein
LLAHRWQKCAICGQRHAKVYKFPFLKDYGVKGKYAAMECLGKLPKPDMTNIRFLPGPPVEDDPEGAV